MVLELDVCHRDYRLGIKASTGIERFGGSDHGTDTLNNMKSDGLNSSIAEE